MIAPITRISCLVVLLSAPLAAAARVPIAVSPGDERGEVPTSACPTFSWAGGKSGGDFEISVYAVSESGVLEDEPQLRQRVPGGATSWTPASDRCLAAGSYAWTVRQIGDAEQWSSPRLFRVPDGGLDDLDRRMERAMERMLERWLAEGRLGGLREARSPVEPAPLGSASDPVAALVDAQAAGSPSFIADASSYDFPDCDNEPPLFSDVPNASTLCPFIKQFVADQIATECAAGRYCPDNVVTRGQLAVYMEKAMRGTDQWDVTADLLDGLDSTAFLQLSGGAMSGNLDLQNHLVLNIGRLQGGSPLRFEGSTVNGIDVTFAITDPTTARTITFPNLSGEVSLLGQAIEPAEISDVQRAVPIALTSLLDCTAAAPIDFTSGVDGAPDFAVPDGSNGLRLTWDLTAGTPDVDFVCTTFAVPPDYLSGGTLRLVSERGGSHNASWFLSWRVLAAGATFVSGNVSAPSCDAGGTDGTIYLCELALGTLAANNGVSFALGRNGGANPATIYALEFVYTADQ